MHSFVNSLRLITCPTEAHKEHTSAPTAGPPPNFTEVYDTPELARDHACALWLLQGYLAYVPCSVSLGRTGDEPEGVD